MQECTLSVHLQRIQLLITTLEAVTHTVKRNKKTAKKKKNHLQSCKKPTVSNNSWLSYHLAFLSAITEWIKVKRPVQQSSPSTGLAFWAHIILGIPLTLIFIGFLNSTKCKQSSKDLSEVSCSPADLTWLLDDHISINEVSLTWSMTALLCGKSCWSTEPFLLGQLNCI